MIGGPCATPSIVEESYHHRNKITSMNEGKDTNGERCGEKRKAQENQKGSPKEKSQKMPWGSGPPPPEWIKVCTLPS